MQKIIKQYILDFLNNWEKENSPEIYNETAFQFELGLYLRDKLKNSEFKVHFERDIVSMYNLNGLYKRNPDILIFKDGCKDKYSIELKYPMPSDGAPDKMFEMLTDIAFVYQLKNNGFAGTYAITLTNREDFYVKREERKAEKTGAPKRGTVFRENYPNIEIKVPSKYFQTKKGTGREVIVPSFTGKWEKLSNGFRYYIIEP